MLSSLTRAVRGPALAGVLLAALGMTPAAAAEPAAGLPDGFVDAADVVPQLVLDIRYHGDENFVGRPIDGYGAPRCLLTRAAADALAGAQRKLLEFGLAAKVFDCYRPARAVAHFARWARDTGDAGRKADYYPELEKKDLFALGYIAERSGHSRGSTLDITIVDKATGEEIDMGSGYDLFSPRSWPTADAAPQHRANRLLLQSVMTAQGFTPYEQEWWHFTLGDEPHPQTYFDFPIPPR